MFCLLRGFYCNFEEINIEWYQLPNGYQMDARFLDSHTGLIRLVEMTTRVFCLDEKTPIRLDKCLSYVYQLYIYLSNLGISGPHFFLEIYLGYTNQLFFLFLCVCVFEMVSVPPMNMAQKMIMMIYPWIECASLISDTPRWVWVNLGIKSHVSD